jgi:hypothetical protein
VPLRMAVPLANEPLGARPTRYLFPHCISIGRSVKMTPRTGDLSLVSTVSRWMRESRYGSSLFVAKAFVGYAFRPHPRRSKPGLGLVERHGGAVRRRRCRHDGGDGPNPPQLGRVEARTLFKDAPDDLAVSEHVIVFVLPLAVRARGEARLRIIIGCQALVGPAPPKFDRFPRALTKRSGIVWNKQRAVLDGVRSG